MTPELGYPTLFRRDGRTGRFPISRAGWVAPASGSSPGQRPARGAVRGVDWYELAGTGVPGLRLRERTVLGDRLARSSRFRGRESRLSGSDE